MLRSRLALWVSIFVFPPLGLVLLWKRDLGVLRRIAGTLAIFIIAIVELIYVYGMRVIWNGTVMPFTVSFESQARHDARVEQHRLRQRAESPPVEPPASAPVAAPPAVIPAAMRIPEKARPAYWTDFRGPDRAGVYTET